MAEPRTFRPFLALAFVVAVLALTSQREPARAEPTAARVTVAAAGDVLFHGRVVAGAIAHGGPRGLERALAGLAAALSAEDLAVVNLEVPLTTEVVPLAGGQFPILGAPPELARALASAGVDVASVANNHAFDQDARGLDLTVKALRRAGVAAVGAGPSPEASLQSTVLERGGLRVAVLGATGTLNRGPRRRDPPMHVARLRPEARTIAAIEAAAGRAHVGVVAVHWSRDFVRRPTKEQRQLARRMVKAGADIVVGSGPHLLQEVERLPSPRGEAVVAYSLGNLISPQGYQVSYDRPRKGHRAAVSPGSRDGAVLRVGLERSGGRLQVVALDAVPLWTRHDRLGRGRPPDIGVVLMRQAPEAVRRQRMPAISSALGPAVRLVP
jgi:poly-gamma-glutamate synthesis protein (capsule biosynthesis protein)